MNLERAPLRSMAWAFAPIRHALLALLLTFSLAGCALNLISNYDETIDRGVSEFHEAFLVFVLDMNRKARTPAGVYESNTGFYDMWTPKLTVMAARAVAINPAGTCPGTETFAGLLQQSFGGLTATIMAQPGPGAAGDLMGDCTARLLQLLERQLGNFGAFHQAQGMIGIPVQARAPVTLMETTIRAVLYTELAKKPQG